MSKGNFDLVRLLWQRKVRRTRKMQKVSGVPPLQYSAKKQGTLKNYRIYGNTVSGESVGDLVESGEHAGEYKVPVTVSNGTDTLTTPIYLPEQIRKVGDYSDYIDHGSQKFVHRVVRKVFDGTEQLKASLSANIIDYIVPVITMRDDGNSINCTSNHISVVKGKEMWANRRVPNAQYVSSFFQNNESKIRFVWNDNDGIVQLSDLTAQLSTWYANGDPLIVDFIVVEPVEEQVTLPALPILTGTNVLSVGTAVQPSKVYIKGEFKKITTTYVQSIKPDNTNNKIIFVVRAYLSEKDRMVRTGLVATNDPAIGVNINVNSTVITSGCKVFVKEAAGVTPTTDNIKYTWTKTKVTDGEIWYVRSYVEYINSDNEQLIIYSDVAKASLDGII